MDGSRLLAIDRIPANSVPSADEISHIRAAVSSDQLEADEIDKKVADLRRQIDQLLDRRQPIVERIDKHKGLIHPIHRLPAEILQEVFAECAPKDIPGSMHAHDCPMVLLSVCKRWRDVALHTPYLWSTMYIPLPTPSKKGKEVAEALVVGLQQWIDRSGSIPLSFTLVHSPGSRRLGPDVDARSKRPMDIVSPILLRHASRWEQLHLATSWESALPFVELQLSNVPRLKAVALYVTATEMTEDGAVDTITNTLSQSPLLRAESLRHLSLSAFPGDTPFLGLPVSWDKLTTLCLDVDHELPCPSAVFPILKTAQRLVELRVSISAVQEDDPSLPAFDEITLPHLRRLHVMEDMWFPAFGKTVRCPKLEHLEYYNTKPSHQSNQKHAESSLVSLLSHYGGQLRSLMFDPGLYTTTTMLAFLADCRMVESLVLARVYNRYVTRHVWGMVDTDFLEALTPPNGLCPRLKSLAFDNAVGFEPGNLLDFLRVKQAGQVPGLERLSRLIVNFQETEIPGLVDQVQELFADKSNVAVKFTVQRVQASLREGAWERALYNQWHSFSYLKYFGKERYPLLTSC